MLCSCRKLEQVGKRYLARGLNAFFGVGHCGPALRQLFEGPTVLPGLPQPCMRRHAGVTC